MFNDFYKNKKVLITGNTGFKGSWLCIMLKKLGAEVVGYSLNPPTDPSLFCLCNLEKDIIQYYGDVRDLEKLKEVFLKENPEIVIHMAAQPIVRDSYKMPVYTYEVNVMGTVNVLDCIRLTCSVKSFVNVTTDKVYLNRELGNPFKEDEKLCGYDPYSNSKSCSELVTYAYKNSFFGGEDGITENGRKIAVSTCRAGNVIGGGDFANDRIIPDCIRAIEKNETITVRNMNSIRPYQHVLEPLYVYIKLAYLQYNDSSFAGEYNIGPDESDCIKTGELVSEFCDIWNALGKHNKAAWECVQISGPHEAGFLKLDSSKARKILEWTPRWSVHEALELIAEWTDEYLSGNDIKRFTELQTERFLEGRE